MKYIVLLRGINVGGRTLKMTELKKCLETAGFRNLISILQTGNLIMESSEANISKLRRQVEDLLEKTFHFPARILVITPEYLEKVIRQYPFQNTNPEFHRYVVFTEDGYEKELSQLIPGLDENIEMIRSGNGVVYWWVLKGHTLDSAFGKHTAKAATKHFLTNRNLNTLEKIIQKCSG